MKNIIIEEINELKENDKSMVLIHAEGCHICEETKPYFDELSNKYIEFMFYKLQFSPEILPFYNSYIPKEQSLVQASYNTGELIFNEDNKPWMVPKTDPNGQILLESPIMFPNFLIFSKEMIDENNEHGFLGNIPGFNKEQVEYVLDQMSTQTVMETEKRSNHG